MAIGLTTHDPLTGLKPVNGSLIVITCKHHGDFTVRPAGHTKGPTGGCPGCITDLNFTSAQSKAVGMTLGFEVFLDRAKKSHGNRYCYHESQKTYTKMCDPVTIRCRKHGLFDQSAFFHSQGSGCPKCSKSYTFDVWVERSKTKFDDQYDLSMARDFYTDYSQREKVPIKCKLHGVLWLNPYYHIKSASGGCKKCTSLLFSIKNSKAHEGKGQVDFNTWLDRAKQRHGDRYDYQKSEKSYTKISGPVVITCKIHGDFTIVANYHSSSKHESSEVGGCKKCSTAHRTMLVKTIGTTTNGEIESRLEAISDNLTQFKQYRRTAGKIQVLRICPHGQQWINLAVSPTYKGKLNKQRCPRCRSSSLVRSLTSDKSKIPNFLSKTVDGL